MGGGITVGVCRDLVIPEMRIRCGIERKGIDVVLGGGREGERHLRIIPVKLKGALSSGTVNVPLIDDPQYACLSNVCPRLRAVSGHKSVRCSEKTSACILRAALCTVPQRLVYQPICLQPPSKILPEWSVHKETQKKKAKRKPISQKKKKKKKKGGRGAPFFF